MYRSLVGWPVAEAAQGFWCGFFGGWRVVGEVAACRRRNTGRRAAGARSRWPFSHHRTARGSIRKTQPQQYS